MGAIRLYFSYVAASIRSQMQYPGSFVMMVLGQFLLTATEFAAIWVLFDRFGMLRSWRLEETALLYSLVSIAFALAETVGRGFDTFAGMVRTGDFDRLLLRPRSAAFQVICREWQLIRIGRLITSGAVLWWAVAHLDIDWSAARMALAALTVIGGMCMFIGLFILQATMAFWTIESLELMNTVTYGGRETGQFPLSIYKPWFRRFFTFIVPLACVSYLPAMAILGRQDTAMDSPLWFQYAAPLVGVAFMSAALTVWRFGVRHYRSTGS